MLIATVALLLAILLFWFGFAQSHWIAPAALFTASGPLVAALSWSYDTERVLAHLFLNFALFYIAFALGRWMGDRTLAPSRTRSHRRPESHWRPS
ncbi:hypothetical protein W911_04375 [Hyphomicrobium nitrativorans NL23]|uniref:Uncharacterized protein n=1 Tax=Hyphomicrobium nitrativorans NL23 TaxID=1029756 RepID=V5SHF1_9HYPH|nr:hypothetical protein [Hyphomicrobium nitrativorans]AHB49927.1 hypothetical protein W911_04375 [Hyphomicrobium nitrativorans NL23]